MNKNIFIAVCALASALAFSSCERVKQTSVYTANVPQYLSYDELRTSVKNDNSQTLEKPGKIFLYNNLILINDFESGVHVYDNSNPTSPEHIAFINVPGNVDIAVRDNILYVDSYVDLVAIDISDPTDVREIGRAEDALSYTIPSLDNWEYPVSRIDQSKGVITDYKVEEIEETCVNEECHVYYSNMTDEWAGTWGGTMMSDQGTAVSFSGNANNVRSSAASNQSGIAGSMARFMLIDNFLYVISDENTVDVFDINTSSMQKVTEFQPWNEAGGFGFIETLFTFKDHLFIGSNSGMLAYDVSDASNPTYLSSYSHMTSCDPVVANDDYAFVTLRSGSMCGWGNDNQLDVLDIEDIMSPSILRTVGLTNPHGLGIDDNEKMLFICDGTAGLKVFDYTNVLQIDQNQIANVTGNETYDVIVFNGIAHVIGTQGLVQYNYSTDGTMDVLSTISLD